MRPGQLNRATPQDLAHLHAETVRTPICIDVVAILDRLTAADRDLAAASAGGA